ncbi:hypothetical protein L249_6255 [Ophiocordyceps polyrhachis-furcata BCC 54312]|uniref:AMP-dependent synthetase/ligase domain-containing protein n=1 Tax=Ophiocordyceps polyrhachis-furcata BCC 54312 TaxID=1330021 RepID=A0A367L0Y6_9HYPO|nr:hypothetical protein L249_6255 [Ophiocordyceps polyrhachis-furcata BCC 54312]
MGILDSIDNGLAWLFGQWNGYSTGLMTALVVVISYRIMASREPDVHPLLLARQSVASAVRHEGESAVYRSQAAPHGLPLSSGLNVKEAGAPRWSRGRDGHLGDVWRRAASGGEDGAKGRILTVMGSEKVVEHGLEDVTRQINIIGRHIADHGGIRVAIYLPNSVELLAALLACSFQPNLTAILMPFNVSADELISMLRRSAVDTLVAAPGTFSLATVIQAYPSLRQLVWVLDAGNSHMDWSEGIDGSVNVATWQRLVKEGSDNGEVSAVTDDHSPQDVVMFWQGDMVRFTQANLVSGIAGQLAAIPARDKMGPWDLFLPVDSLTNVYTLVLTLAAVYSNASLALNSVAGPAVDLVLATKGIAPTVVVVGPETLAGLHKDSVVRVASGLGRLSHAMSTRTLAGQGVFAPANVLSVFSPRPAIGTTPGKLRLIYAADRAGTGMARLSSAMLSDVRIMTGARVVYALSAGRVAGAVSQTSLFDYRVDGGSHFGAPPTSVEVFFRDKGGYKTTDSAVEGEVMARGPCVSGAEASTGVVGRMRPDQTLSCI